MKVAIETKRTEAGGGSSSSTCGGASGPLWVHTATLGWLHQVYIPTVPPALFLPGNTSDALSPQVILAALQRVKPGRQGERRHCLDLPL